MSSTKFVTSEMDDLKVENRHLYCLILQLILDLNELEELSVIPGQQPAWHPPKASKSR